MTKKPIFMIALAIREMSEERIDQLTDAWHQLDGRHAQAIDRFSLLSTQEFLYADRVGFYVMAIRLGMFPRPGEGLRLPDGRVLLLEGHHRAHAWLECGFPVPVFVQEPDEV